MKESTPNIGYTLQHDICTGCGICQGACPSNAISFHVVNGEFRPQIDNSKCKNDKGCHRCYDSCPGLGIKLTEFANKTFTDDDVRYDKMCGRYIKCFSGYSKDYDIRYHSASGGVVSQFLIWLLENKKIDGAVVTRFNKTRPLLVETFIATTREEIISSRSSKYSPVSHHDIVKSIKEASGRRYVIVGLPCHIEGYRKLMNIDKQLREKVVGLFSLYCACIKTFNQTEYLMKVRHIPLDKINYFQYRDEGCLGSMVVKYQNGLNKGTNEVYKERFGSYYQPLRSIFNPRRCIFCIDHYGELGDISFGDIHVEPYSNDEVGVNSIIVRNKYWLNLLIEARDVGVLTLDGIPFETVSSSQKMSFIKKGRNGAFINIGKKFGWVMPDFGVGYLRQPGKSDYIKFVMNRCLQFIGRHHSLWWIIRYIKKK